MFVKLAARVGFVVLVIVIVVLGQVPAFDFAILALGALLSRRTFGYLSPQQQKERKGAPRWFWKVSLFSLGHVQRGAWGVKDLNAFALDIFLKWLCGQQRDSIWIRFGYLAALAEKGLWYSSQKFAIKLAMKRKQPAQPIHRERERHWKGELWRGTRNQIKFAKLFVIWVSESAEEEQEEPQRETLGQQAVA